MNNFYRKGKMSECSKNERSTSAKCSLKNIDSLLMHLYIMKLLVQYLLHVYNCNRVNIFFVKTCFIVSENAILKLKYFFDFRQF